MTRAFYFLYTLTAILLAARKNNTDAINNEILKINEAAIL